MEYTGPRAEETSAAGAFAYSGGGRGLWVRVAAGRSEGLVSEAGQMGPVRWARSDGPVRGAGQMGPVSEAGQMGPLRAGHASCRVKLLKQDAFFRWARGIRREEHFLLSDNNEWHIDVIHYKCY